MRWGPLNPPTRWALGATSLIIPRRTTTSPMTTNPPKRKLRLNFAPIGAGGMIRIHHSIKIILASFRDWDHLSPRLPLSRELKKRKRSSRFWFGRAQLDSAGCVPKGPTHCYTILIYEDSRREVVQQCIANLISTFHLYPHSEVIASFFTDRVALAL